MDHILLFFFFLLPVFSFEIGRSGLSGFTNIAKYSFRNEGERLGPAQRLVLNTC